jgi:hypothetical protein
MKKISMIREVQRQLKAEGFKWTQKEVEHFIYEQLENGGPDDYETQFDQSDCNWFADQAIGQAIRDEEDELAEANYVDRPDDDRDEYIYEPGFGQPA